MTRELLNAALIALGILSAGLGLKGFLLPSGFIDGGVTGVSLLMATVTGPPLAFWLPVINGPFVFIGYRYLGAAFAIRSALAIGALAAVLALVQYPAVTQDRLLDAVFGGFFLGAGIGLAVRGGAVLDGTEIAALLISKRSTLLRVGDVILAFNVALFTVAMAVLGVEAALYSILTYLTAARTLDFVIHGIEEFTAMTIVSNRSAEIRDALTGMLGRGVTVYRGRGGLTNAEQDILYCVVTRLEIGKIKAIARDIDRSAFIVSHALSDVEGGVVKKTALQIADKRRV
ncbi:MAG: YitT family protein [Acidobacteria bacterium]|nr:MAG: YitT family protein [Acidobacteriota bacterium]